METCLSVFETLWFLEGKRQRQLHDSQLSQITFIVWHTHTCRHDMSVKEKQIGDILYLSRSFFKSCLYCDAMGLLFLIYLQRSLKRHKLTLHLLSNTFKWSPEDFHNVSTHPSAGATRRMDVCAPGGQVCARPADRCVRAHLGMNLACSPISPSKCSQAADMSPPSDSMSSP